MEISMRVRVTKEGFMFGSTQKVGTQITLKEDRHFSEKWMEKIEDVVADEHDKEPEKKEEKSKKPKD